MWIVGAMHHTQLNSSYLAADVLLYSASTDRHNLLIVSGHDNERLLWKLMEQNMFFNNDREVRADPICHKREEVLEDGV